MKTRQPLRYLPVLLAVLVLFACGRNDPAAMIASAKAYLAKSDTNAAIVQLKNVLQQAPNNPEARILLARALLEGGDPVGAETEIRKAIELKYAGEDALPLLGSALIQQREFQKVVSELSGRKLTDPQARAGLSASLALAYIGLGRVPDARAAIDAALAAVPRYPGAQMAMAQLAAAENDLPGALELVNSVLKQTPDDLQAVLFKADLEVAKNQVELAVKTLERLVELRPDSVRARFALITTLVRAGQVAIAAAQLDSLRKLAPRDPRTLYSEALIAYSRGNMQATRDAVQQALSMAPEHMPSVLLFGLANYRLGSYQAAEESLRTVVAKVPTERNAVRGLAAIYLRTGRISQAFEVLDRALQSAPNDSGLLQSAGEAYLASNNPTKAAEMYERAAALDKADVGSRVRLAQVRMESGDAARAFKDLEAIAAANPALAEVDLAVISAHLRRRESAEALAAASAMERKQPENPMAHNIKGVVYLSLHDSNKARASFEQALKLDPAFAAATLNLAQLDFLERNIAGARKRYEQVLVQEPANEQALLGLAGLLAATRAPDSEIKAAIGRAIAANPSSVRPHMFLVGYYARQKDAKAALAAAQAAQASFPDNPQVLELVGAAQQNAGDFNQALESFTRAAKLQPQDMGPLLRIAGVQSALKDYDGAIKTLHQAIALQPDFTPAWLALSGIYTTTERASDGIADARKLQKAHPTRGVGFALEGQMLVSQKKPAEASVVFREGLAREPVPLLSIMTYASLQSAGKPDQAVAMAQRWQKEHPNDIQLLIYQGQQSLAAKEYSHAAQHFKAVLALDPDNVIALNNFAWTLNELGDPKSLEYAERAYAIASTVPSVVDTYGWILLQRGDAKKGLDMLRDASGLAPDNPEIRLHLAKALVKAGDKASARRELEALAARGDASQARTEAQQMLKGL
jgi:putative PEP-CTERM system TPR-repeat lipoprotein